jgi:hypothetical protein
MTQERKPTQRRDSEQRRLRARAHTEQMREEHDELDLPREHLPGAGILLPGTDLGPEDEGDDDLFPEDEDAEAAALDSEEDPPRQAARVTLADLLGSRPPVVHLRLGEYNGSVEVAVCHRAWSPGVAETLEELRELLLYLFTARSPQFNQEEWDALLWGKNAAPGRRLLLLSRLAVTADTLIEPARIPFRPHDRSLKRYHGKIAALPDGMPFSMRLLLLDLRGRRHTVAAQAPASGLLDLPDAVLLLALRRVFAAEAREKQAHGDYQLGPVLWEVLAEMGITLPARPSEEEVRTVRERRNWKKLGLFLNARQRRLQYGAGPAADEELEENPV